MANSQSYQSITRNIPSSIAAALRSGSAPFVTMPWIANVSAITRKRRSPVCC